MIEKRLNRNCLHETTTAISVTYRLLMAHMIGARATSFNIKPDWEYSLKLMNEARDIAKEEDLDSIDAHIKRIERFMKLSEKQKERIPV